MLIQIHGNEKSIGKYWGGRGEKVATLVTGL